MDLNSLKFYDTSENIIGTLDTQGEKENETD